MPVTDCLTLMVVAFAASVTGDTGHSPGSIISPVDDDANFTSFDIVAAHVHMSGAGVTFHMTTNGIAGEDKPTKTGKGLANAKAHAYVWPTTLDPSVVGFPKKTGMLALVAANHPDFDDTPKLDENKDGNKNNDGGTWHTHWVVLVKDEGCGAKLTVKDIPNGTEPQMPKTWPGKAWQFYLSNPGYVPKFDGPKVSITATFADGTDLSQVNYDGVTVVLRVNKNLHAPLFCVEDVFDIASGDLSSPGVLNPTPVGSSATHPYSLSSIFFVLLVCYLY